MKHTTKNTTCPRCGGGIPNDYYRGQYPGAISRVDNETEICSGCGTDEAMEQFMTGTIDGSWLLEVGFCDSCEKPYQLGNAEDHNGETGVCRECDGE